MDFDKKRQKLKFKIKWQVKTNHEMIKLVEFIPQENILCTSSFDKKIKIWNAQTGQYIDSFQQNYKKCVPEPIAYYDTRNYLLYSKNKNKTIDRVKVDLLTLQADCFSLQKFIDNYDLLKN